MRVRVAISTPDRDSAHQDEHFAIHVGHARTLYHGALIAEARGCPFEVRLDGSVVHFGQDLRPFEAEVGACLHFLGIVPSRVYWQPQVAYSDEWLDDYFSRREQALLRFIEFEKGPTEIAAILDDVENHLSVIVRGREFLRPEVYMGTPVAIADMQRYKAIEAAVFELAGVRNDEINLPLVTIGGRKFSKRDGRFVSWRVLETLGAERARLFLEEVGGDGCDWEWDWVMFGQYARGG